MTLLGSDIERGSPIVIGLIDRCPFLSQVLDCLQMTL